MATAFEIYLRTGRVRSRSALEVKFNPWHDPDDGRFTFRNSGKRFGDGGVAGFARRPSATDPRVIGLGGARRARREKIDYDRYAPENPHNHSIHVVQRGESVTSIARTRTGLRPHDLATLNGLRDPDRLKIGQRLKLPHQSYLDDGKRARDKFMALAFYMDRHGGRLPPDVAHPPSIESQVDADFQTETRNGHVFHIDGIGRTRHVDMTLGSPVVERRSRKRQRNAGKPDRLHTDDGGHYVAPRFGGPPEVFNHFAQDANFNRGAYRQLEDQFEVYRKARKSVPIKIDPKYDGLSQRPSEIQVKYRVDGVWLLRRFKNRKGGK
jgi:LysM repeat protein